MTESLKPCRSPYCECTVGECSHPGCYDARGEEFPLNWKWHQAPVKTQWGDEMVVASLAIDKDHTVNIYCERDQTAAVERMLTKSAAQRQWVELTDEQMPVLFMRSNVLVGFTETKAFVQAISAKLKELNRDEQRSID
jgi:hypothetical protein